MTLEKYYKDDFINLGCELTEECFACGYIVQVKYDDLLHDSIGEIIFAVFSLILQRRIFMQRVFENGDFFG